MDAMMYYMEQYQQVYLVQTYPSKTNIIKILSFWFVPYLGFLFVFKDVLALQRYLNGGRTVFEYVEDRLKAETAERA